MTDPAARLHSARIEGKTTRRLIDHLLKEARELRIGSDERRDRLFLIETLNAHLHVLKMEEISASSALGRELHPPVSSLTEPTGAEMDAMLTAASNQDENEQQGTVDQGAQRRRHLLKRLIKLGGAHNLPILAGTIDANDRLKVGR